MKPLRELMSLSGRKAIVTGGAGHIGSACAETLLEQGAEVAILDKDAGACERMAKTLGGGVTPLPCDLSCEESTRETIDKAVDQLGGLEILVHCAAYVGTTHVQGWAEPFDKQTVAAWDSALRVNLTAPFVMVQQARKALERSGRASVVLFASTYGLVGPDMSLYAGTSMSNPVGYGASKGGVLQLTRYLSTLLAPAVRVNAISPGGVLRGQPEAFRERYENRTPLRRMASEEDLKGAVAYLASDLSSYVTGHNLVVDGGWTSW